MCIDRRLLSLATPAVMFCIAASALAADEKDVMCAADERTTMKRDAVAAIAGKELAGDSRYAATHAGYTYWFANATNKAAFEKSPQRYEIQFGGACARMGPLSGRGHPELNTVHDGQLFIFASRQCREAFVKSPDKLLEHDDPRPTPDESSRRRGAELLERMIQHLGGAARVDAIRTLRQHTDRVQDAGGKKYRTSKTLTVAFPDRVRRDESWEDSTWGFVAVGEKGYLCESKSADVAMAPSQRRAFSREYGHHPLLVARARQTPAFVAHAVGAGNAGGQSIEWVSVWVDGVTTTFGINPSTGMLHAIRYQGRGPRLTIGTIERTVTERKTIDGITLPAKWSTQFDGKDEATMAGELTRIEIDPVLAADTFASKALGLK